jgi:A/G-specific adenine glycosylase
VSDEEIMPLVEQCLYGKNPRVWYWALMDYGTMLKKSGMDKNTRSRHYKKQGRFEGSRRQVRGKILKVLVNGNMLNVNEIHDALQVTGNDIKRKSVRKKNQINGDTVVEILEGLKKDGMVREERGKFYM